MRAALSSSGDTRPPGDSVALGFHGHFDREGLSQTAHKGSALANGRACSDFFLVAQNVKHRLIEPLEAKQLRVMSFFHTYSSGCPQRDKMLIDMLRPQAYQFATSPLPHAAYSCIAVLQMVQRARTPRPQTVLLVRFDVVYRVSVTALNIQWEATNIAWRHHELMWQRKQWVSDLYFALPLTQVPALISAFNVTSQQNGSTRSWLHVTHGVYAPLKRLIGESSIHFIDPAFRISNVNVGARLHTPYLTKESHDASFMLIDRNCSLRDTAWRHYCGAPPPQPLLSYNLYAPAAARVARRSMKAQTSAPRAGKQWPWDSLSKKDRNRLYRLWTGNRLPSESRMRM